MYLSLSLCLHFHYRFRFSLSLWPCCSMAPSSPSSSSSSSSSSLPLSKLCFHCREEATQFIKGWKLRSGGFAGLCARCGSAYEEGKFCDIFHLNADGWRDCATCGKMVHCGCIMSFHLFTVLDFGGVSCMKCFNKNSNVAPNQEPPSHATPEISQKQKLGDPSEVGLSVDSDKVMTGIDCGEDPIASLGPPVSHELPKETNVKLLAPSSPSQKQDSPAQFAEQFNANSPNGEDTSCDTHMVSEKSEGDSYEQLCSHPQNLPEESDDELQPLSRVSKSVVIPLFEKYLTPSDSDTRMARLVIPKKCAEAYFPKVSEGQGFPIVFQDAKGEDWEFHLRFWVNCNSKMYVLEGLKEYMTLMRWQAGDIVTFHRREPEGKLVIGTKKAVPPPLKE